MLLLCLTACGPTSDHVRACECICDAHGGLEIAKGDLTNTCCLRAVQAEQATYLIIYQAEDRELAGLALVFEAMLTSLMRSLQ